MVFQFLDFPEIRSFPAGSDGRFVLGRDGRLHGQARLVADVRAGGPDGRSNPLVLPGLVHQQAGEGTADEEAPEKEIAHHGPVRSRHLHHQEGGVAGKPIQGFRVEVVGVEPRQILIALAGEKRFQGVEVIPFQQGKPAGGDIDLTQDVPGDPAHVAVPEPEQEAVQVFDPVPYPGKLPFEGDEKADHTNTSL